MELFHPFTMIIAGPSGSGKTVFTKKILESRNIFTKTILESNSTSGKKILEAKIVRVEFSEIIWCYSEIGSLGKRMSNITYQEGLPSEDQYDGTPKLVILDDLMHETNESVAKLFTKISHHRNVSVISITQNIFSRNKNSRDISLNVHYLTLFKNPRDKAQISYLARQVCPENSKFFMDSFYDATSSPHGYLFVDFKQETSDSDRISSDIFYKHPAVYKPR